MFRAITPKVFSGRAEPSRKTNSGGVGGLVPPLLLAVAVAVAASPAAGQQAAAAFRRAEGVRAWSFPRDHGQHPAYLLEWWYYTGLLTTAEGRRFGYQVTFFRKGLRQSPGRTSAWAARSLFAGHAALSDLAGGSHLFSGITGREALGLSGASAERHQVWLRRWRADPLPGDPHGAILKIEDPRFALQLTLRAAAPPILHGEGGLDRKGGGFGQASWYYSLPRLATEGTLVLRGVRHRVRGTTWMDHEFGTNQLDPAQAGWDWFGLRLDDGRDLMLYRLRHRDGSSEPLSGGTLVTPGGGRETLRLAGAEPPTGRQAGRPAGSPGGVAPPLARLTPLRWWRSPASGARYPIAWKISLPARNLRLTVEAAFAGQELAAGPGIPFHYWEGVVRVSGTSGGAPISGEGYMELTGYAGGIAEFFR